MKGQEGKLEFDVYYNTNEDEIQLGLRGEIWSIVLRWTDRNNLLRKEGHQYGTW